MTRITVDTDAKTLTLQYENDARLLEVVQHELLAATPGKLDRDAVMGAVTAALCERLQYTALHEWVGWPGVVELALKVTDALLASDLTTPG